MVTRHSLCGASFSGSSSPSDKYPLLPTYLSPGFFDALRRDGQSISQPSRVCDSRKRPLQSVTLHTTLGELKVNILELLWEG